MEPDLFDFKTLEKLYKMAKVCVDWMQVHGWAGPINYENIDSWINQFGKDFRFNPKNSFDGGLLWGVALGSGVIDIAPYELEGLNIDSLAFQAASDLARKMVIGDVKSLSDAQELFGLI